MAAALPMHEALFGRRVGAGAPWPTLRQGDKFAVTIQVAAADAALPLTALGVPQAMAAGASVGLKGPPDSLGFVTFGFTGTYSGTAPYQIPTLFLGVAGGQYSGRNATVLAATSTPAMHIQNPPHVGGKKVVIPVGPVFGGTKKGGTGVVQQPAAGWSTTKKVAIYGGGAAALLVIAAGASKAAGWW